MKTRECFYNFCRYIELTFPAETVFKNGRIKIGAANKVPDRNILITDTGGVQNDWDELATRTVQIITRDVDVPGAYELSLQIFEEIQHRFGLELPAVTVGSVTYPLVDSAAILNTSYPQSLGADEKGLFEYSANYLIKFLKRTRG